MLTDRQKDIVRFIADYIDAEKYPPTMREIGRHFRIASTNGVNDHLVSIEAKGYIERRPFISRGLVLTGRARRMVAAERRAA